MFFNNLSHCPMCAAEIAASHYFGKRLDRSQGFSPERIKGVEITINKCAGCGLIYPNPLPLPENKNRFTDTSTESFWGAREQAYEHFKAELGVLRHLVKKPLQDQIALDIGFGMGNSLVTLSAAFKETHGIEPFAGFYQQAITLYGKNLNTSFLKQGDVEATEFGSEQFDFIFFEAIQHVTHLEGAMKKVLSWLKPGGILYVEVPSSNYLLHKAINAVYKLKRTGFVMNTNPMHGNFSYYEFSDKSFIENGRLLGYQVIHKEVYVCGPLATGTFGWLLAPLMRLTGTGMQRSIWMQKD